MSESRPTHLTNTRRNRRDEHDYHELFYFNSGTPPRRTHERPDSVHNLIAIDAAPRLYEGFRVELVYHDMEKELTPDRSQAIRHLSNEFDWGRRGRGAKQTALAILLELTNNERATLRLYRKFAREVITKFPVEGWSIKIQFFHIWLESHQALVSDR